VFSQCNAGNNRPLHCASALYFVNTLLPVYFVNRPLPSEPKGDPLSRNAAAAAAATATAPKTTPQVLPVSETFTSQYYFTTYLSRFTSPVQMLSAVTTCADNRPLPSEPKGDPLGRNAAAAAAANAKAAKKNAKRAASKQRKAEEAAAGARGVLLSKQRARQR
jgi:hypothetical protein